tara:strand:+ start:178 stop:744 length:567 start_codon:yes stop_codon:yes gene_type:complete
MALSKINTAGLAADSVDNTILDLTSNFAFTGTVSGAGGTSVAIIGDQKTQGTHSGGATAGSWFTRDLNTEFFDPDGIVSISSNQFTLGAGKYFIEFSVPAYDCARHRSRLYNVTASSVVANSIAGNLGTSDDTSGTSTGRGYVDISSNTVFEIQQRVTSTKSNSGQGLRFNLSGEVEFYTQVAISKVG